MSESSVERGGRVAELINKRTELKKKLDVLPNLLEERKINVEDFKTLKEDYKEKLENIQKEINLLSVIKEEETIQPKPEYVEKKSAGIAAVLSFLFVGLGQIYNGLIAKGRRVSLEQIVGSIAIVCIIIGASWITYNLLPEQHTQQNKIFVGAYIEYKVEGFMVFLPINGTFRWEVVDVTEKDYTVSTSGTGILGIVKHETKTYGFGEHIGPPFIEEMNYVGEEKTRTKYGMKKLSHYQREEIEKNDTVTTDVYIDNKINTVFLIYMKYEPSHIWTKIEISDTNISWIK